MASTTFVDNVGPAINAAWLNDVNNAVYDGTNQVNVYNPSGETTRFSKLVHSSTISGSHSGTEWSANYFAVRPVGSGTNGPTSADYGVTISAIKQGWPTSTVSGEVDGLNVVTRNCSTGAGYQGDTAGILVNTGVVGSGYAAAIETQTSVLSTVGGIIRQVTTQIGMVDPVAGTYNGFFTTPSAVASATSAFQVGVTATSGWGWILKADAFSVSGPRPAVYIEGDGHLVLYDVFGGGQSKTLRVNGSLLAILNHARTAEIIRFLDNGTVNALNSYQVADIQVVGARATGWTAGTGTPNKGAFAADTATAVQAAQRILAIEQALRTHGLIN